MERRRSRLPGNRKQLTVIAASVIAMTSTAIVSTQTTATAAPTLTCDSAALVMGVSSNGNLWHRGHNEPETGASSWGAKVDAVGRGWNIGRAVAGPSGTMYLMVASTGVLRRYHWTGTSWEKIGESWHRDVGTDWSRYTQAEHRNKVAVDEKGRLYEISADGSLKVRVWVGDHQTGNWTPDTTDGKVIDTGWDQYNLITAAGDGVLFARKPNGDLHRYRWHAESNRFLQYGTKVGAGWGVYKRVFSPGGDVLYASRTDNGDLAWYRWHESTNSWASRYATKIGSGFASELDLVANSNSCRLTGFPIPTRPNVPQRPDAAVTPLRGTDGLVTFFYVNSAGGLTFAKQRDPGRFDILEYQTFTGHHKYTGQPGAGVRPDGKFEVLANSYDDATFRGKTQQTANGSWGAGDAFAQGGWMVSDAAVIAENEGALATYAVDGAGALWRRAQSTPSGTQTTWFRVGEGLTADFTVVRNGSASDVIARFDDGSLRTARYTATGLGAWRVIGTNTVGKPAAVAHPNGDLQVFVRGTDQRVHTQRESGGTFSGTWQQVGDFVVAGAPAAVLDGDGLVELAARGTDNLVHQASQLAPAGGFGDWHVEYAEDTATDPAGTVLANGSPIFSWRSPQGVIMTVYQPSGTTDFRGVAAR